MTFEMPSAARVKEIRDAKNISMFAARDQALRDNLLAAIDEAVNMDDVKEILRVIVNRLPVTSY
jgi:hypothetical protein